MSPSQPAFDHGARAIRARTGWAVLLVLLVLLVVVNVLVYHAAFRNRADEDLPRLLQNTEDFHQRVHEGLEHLHRSWQSREEIPAGHRDGTLRLVRTHDAALPVAQQQWIWEFPSAVLPVGDLPAFHRVVSDGWEIPRLYPSSGSGGGGGAITLGYGDAHSYTTIHLTAFEQGGTTTLHSQAFVIGASAMDAGWSAHPPATFAASTDFRLRFVHALQERCNPYIDADAAGRTRGGPRYVLSDRMLPGHSSPNLKEGNSRWIVPAAALAPDGLREFTTAIAADWDTPAVIAAGLPYSVTITFGNGAHQTCIHVIAIPGNPAPDGTPETRIHYRKTHFLGRPWPPVPTKPAPPVDFEKLEKIPGSAARERAENAMLDGDGRMLKNLRQRNEARPMRWRLEYNLHFSEAPGDDVLEAFANDHGMTWEMTTRTGLRDGLESHYVRFFKVMDFSEAEIVSTTAAVRQFAGQLAGRYVGWNFKNAP